MKGGKDRKFHRGRGDLTPGSVARIEAHKTPRFEPAKPGTVTPKPERIGLRPSGLAPQEHVSGHTSN